MKWGEKDLQGLPVIFMKERRTFKLKRIKKIEKH